MHVRVRHVYLRAQHHLAFLYLTALHRLKEAQVLLHSTVAIRRSHTRLRRRTFLLGYLLRRLLVHVGLAGSDETDSEVVQLLEIIGGIVYLSPLETQPADVTLDGLYVFSVLFGRVRVVETQVTNTVVFLCDAEVHANRLHVTDVQVTVRLRRETRLNTTVIHSFCQVFLYNLLNEIETLFLLFHISLIR